MKATISVVWALFVVCAVSVSAFSPTTSRPVLTPGRLIQARSMASFILKAEEKQAEETAASSSSSSTELSNKVDADGNYYDDEVEPAPKQGISDSMKERLMREASTGLDADQKQTNVLLYIILGVAVLVVLGGQGILY